MKGDYTKAKQISQETKQKVYDRQNGKSVLSGLAITKEMCCCHFIGRGLGGVGYEWNIIGLTPEEHRQLDLNQTIYVGKMPRWTNKEAHIIIQNHLNLNYNGWSIEKCKYQKYKKEEDYEVTRKKDRIF